MRQTTETIPVDSTETIACVGNINIITPETLAVEELFQERVIWLDKELEEEDTSIIKQILCWNKFDLQNPKEKPAPIRLMIFSPGGSVYVNRAIIDTIKMSRTPVYGFNAGKAHSAGASIFLACHKRFAFENSSFLLHKGSAAISGTAEEVGAWNVEYEKILAQMIDHIYENSNLSRKEISKNLKGDWYFTAREAKRMGMVDKIVHKVETIWE